MTNLDQLLLDALDRSSKREWTVGLEAADVPFDEASEQVARVLEEHLAQQDANGGHGQALILGLYYCNEVFGTIAPTRLQVEAAVKDAQDDYGTFCALSLLAQIVATGVYPSLDDWRSSVFLELDSVPPRPKGRSKFALALRDAILVGQVRQLESIGYIPTRNSDSKRANGNSACDVVAKATERVSGLPVMSYVAVERVWKKRHKPFFGTVGNEFVEDILGALERRRTL